MWQLDWVRHITKGVMRQKSQYVLSMVCFLLLLMPLTASAGPGSWLILQTCYQITPVSDGVESATEKEYNKLSCVFCRNIASKPYQDSLGKRGCKDCMKKMEKFISQYGLDPEKMEAGPGKVEGVEFDSLNAYYGALLKVFPEYRGSKEELAAYIRDLKKELSTERGAYSINPDKAHAREVKDLQENNALSCDDCYKKFESCGVWDVFSHAEEHRLVCEACGFNNFTEEGVIPNLERRRELLAEHEAECVVQCAHCADKYSLAVMRCHEPACLKKSITCGSCNTDDAILLGQYEKHIVSHYSLSPGENDHHTVTCPVCQQRVSGLDYPLHYERLHAGNPDKSQSCPYCEELFYSGSYLFKHAQGAHAAEMVQILNGSDQHADDLEEPGKNHLMLIIEAVKPSTVVGEARGNRGAAVDNTEAVAKLEAELAALKLAGSKRDGLLESLCSAERSRGEQVHIIKTQLPVLARKVETLLSITHQSYACEGTDTTAMQRLETMARANAVYLSELDRRQEEQQLTLLALPTCTYNGCYIWRIPEIERHRRNAIDDRVTSIYSPPFYTDRNGYKMCMRAYLNGDGMGYKTHLSLFFVLMKGEFDSLLNWPFEYKITFILLNQAHGKDIEKIFKPSVESNSFQRPLSYMNVASGCPQFAKLTVLSDDDYVTGDVMFIKCIVDITKIAHP